MKADPKGAWAAKIRFELAGLELAAGRAAAAEELARAEAERLLAGDRKDRLAGVYYAFARRLLKPDDPVTPPDPKGAYELLTQARGLAKGAALVATLLLAMARAAQAAGNHAQAVADFQEYLKEPKAPERVAARYRLGEAQFHLGQLAEARVTWADLARELEKAPGAGEVRARALYQRAMTRGIPNPPDDPSLSSASPPSGGSWPPTPPIPGPSARPTRSAPRTWSAARATRPSRRSTPSSTARSTAPRPTRRSATWPRWR